MELFGGACRLCADAACRFEAWIASVTTIAAAPRRLADVPALHLAEWPGVMRTLPKAGALFTLTKMNTVRQWTATAWPPTWSKAGRRPSPDFWKRAAPLRQSAYWWGVSLRIAGSVSSSISTRASRRPGDPCLSESWAQPSRSQSNGDPLAWPWALANCPIKSG